MAQPTNGPLRSGNVGAHYFTDVLAGSCMAFVAYALAVRIIRLEDSLFSRETYASPAYAPAQATVAG